ncbi:MAG: VWA domain-containing protein [Bauldia sp.]|nr:VWA domain-containing protein [Bauldia sp.]
MTLLAPAWLLLGALAAVVVALHARRRRRVEIPSLQIWSLLERSSSRTRSFRRPPLNLILALQLLFVLLIAIALARPTAGADPDRPDHVIYVLDASGSMRTATGTGDRLAAAIDHLRQRIEARTDADRASVVTAGPVARLLIARQTMPGGMLPILDLAAAGDGAADWAAAAEWAAMTIRPGETTRVVVITDGADGGDAVLADLLAGVDMARLLVGEPAAPNAGLTAVVEALPGQPGVWRVTGSVLATGDAGIAEVSVRFARSGGSDFLDWGVIPLGEVEAQALDGTAPARPFEAELSLPGAGTLVLALPQDSGPQDNAVSFVLRDAPRMVRILLLGAENPDLVRALRAVPFVDLLASDALPADDEAFDLVVVNDVALERRPDTNVLWLGRGGVAGDAEPAIIADATLIGWNDNHVLSRGIDWRELAAPRIYAVPTRPGAEVIVEAAGGPLVQARTTASGREVAIAVGLEGADWVRTTGFPVLIANIVGWLGIAGDDVAASCTVGARCLVEARFAGQPISDATGAVVRPAAPAGSEHVLETSFVPERAGLYRIGNGDDAIVVAVNASGLAETATARLPGAEGTPVTDLPGNLPPPWWWIVLAALVVLLLEAWLAGRGQERFLQRTALTAGVPHSGRRRALLALRVAVLCLLAASLVQLPWPTPEPAAYVVAVVTGDLPGTDGGAARRELTAAMAAPETSLGTGWVVAGAVPRVASDLFARGGQPTASAIPLGADLEGAALLAVAMLPGDRPGRVVLAADGNETTGRLGDAAAFLTSRGVPVDVLPLDDHPAGEVLVETVSVPTAINEGEAIPLAAIVVSQAATAARVSVMQAGVVVVEEDIDLFPGRNLVEVTLPAGVAGDTLFEVVVTAASDVIPGNNRNGTMASIAAGPSVVIVTPDTDWGNFFADALAVQGLAATVIAPDRTPWSLAGWLEYDLVVLMNVPAIDLDTRKQEMLEDYVTVHGRGLLILGGEHAFGPGGYYQTPLERISPLSSRIPHEAPVAALAFVLDRSGSMQARVEDLSRLDIAKEATLSAVSLLNDESQVAVILFDSESRVVVPLQARKDEAAIAAALAPIQPGGGTVLFPALSLAFAELQRSDAEARHIIIMTDGLVEPAEFAPLVAQIREAGITISAVAIGDAARSPELEPIARLGGGAFHATRDVKALPSILSQEAMLLSGTPVVDRTSPVFWVDRSAAFLTGLPDEMPPIENYVATTPQPGATVHLALIDEEGETIPVLASWRQGAGSVLALATHGAGSGTQNWLRLPQYPLLWAQAVRSFLPIVEGPGLHASFTRTGDEVAIRVDILDPDGVPLAGQTVTATDLAGIAVDLRATAPGRYEAALGTLPAGTHSFSVAGADLTVTASLHVGYPARLDFGRANVDSLAAIATATGGAVLVDAGAALATGSRWVARPQWIGWALIALALFFLDLAIRYAPTLLGIARRPVPVGGGPGASRTLGKGLPA